jgi:hypothetical protein
VVSAVRTLDGAGARRKPLAHGGRSAEGGPAAIWPTGWLDHRLCSDTHLIAQPSAASALKHIDLVPKLNAALEGRYRVDRAIGRGGMATVYLAEIRTTAKLQHPNILPLYDSGVADKLVYYVMPCIEGETIEDRLTREGPLPIGDAVRIVQGAAAALR